MKKETTTYEIAELVWRRISLINRCDFFVSKSRNHREAVEYTAAMMMVAGKVMILANRDGGGKPFCFSVTGKPNNKEKFIVEFQAYMMEEGTHFWTDGIIYDAKRSCAIQPMEIGLREFANILLQNSAMPLEVWFEKSEADKESGAPYPDETFAFCFTDLADAIIGVCNSDSRHVPFCGDVTDDECVNTFTSKFVDYLKSCGFRHSVRAFVNGSKN